MALRISIVLFFIVQFYVARAQYDQFLGNFPIYNFTNDDFNSPVQIWTGCQTENDASRQNGGKKFKSKHFKQFLIDISHHEMKTQEKLIVEKFDNWRGEIEAIDDVCVFGVKI